MVFDEPGSASIHDLLAEDPAIVVWWQTEIECASAFARKEREKRLPSKAFSMAGDRLHQLAADWQEVAPSRGLREIAKRLVGTHSLKAADAAQLAAALTLAEGDPASLAFVSLDQRLRDAAAREGFTRVLPYPMS